MRVWDMYRPLGPPAGKKQRSPRKQVAQGKLLSYRASDGKLRTEEFVIYIIN